MFRQYWSALFLLLVLGPCFALQAQTSPMPTDGSERPVAEEAELAKDSLGSTNNVHRLGDLFFGGQFAQDDIIDLKARGIERVITMRMEREVEWNEKALVEQNGMEFVAIRCGAPSTMTDEIFGNVRKALSADPAPVTLFHCGSATRVAAAWLPYRVLDQNIPLDQAVEEAREIGLRSKAFENRALEYIKQQQEKEETKSQPKESVKPGINDSFTDPELDVDAYVKRFEVESREVYLNRQAIVEACEIESGDRVADVGAGTGLFTRLFAQATGNDGWVFAVDIAPRFIEHINAESKKQNLDNITGVICAEDSVNLPPDSVDVVFICDTYHHFEYPKSTMTSINRALKKDGHLIVIDFDRIEGVSRPWLISHVRAGKEVFRAEIQDAGFKLVEEKKLPGFEENYFLKFRKSK